MDSPEIKHDKTNVGGENIMFKTTMHDNEGNYHLTWYPTMKGLKTISCGISTLDSPGSVCHLKNHSFPFNNSCYWMVGRYCHLWTNFDHPQSSRTDLATAWDPHEIITLVNHNLKHLFTTKLRLGLHSCFPVGPWPQLLKPAHLSPGTWHLSMKLLGPQTHSW